LVVQVCPLGTISRKIPQAAPPLIRRRADGRPVAAPVYANDLALTSCVSTAGVDRGVAAPARVPGSGEIRDENRLKSINKANAVTVKMRGARWPHLPLDHAF
jgi:hypothetical protein